MLVTVTATGTLMTMVAALMPMFTMAVPLLLMAVAMSILLVFLTMLHHCIYSVGCSACKITHNSVQPGCKVHCSIIFLPNICLEEMRIHREKQWMSR